MPLHYAGFDMLATMVLIIRADGQILYANTAFESALGLSLRASGYTHITDMLEDATLPELLASVSQGLVHTGQLESVLIRPLGQPVLPVHLIIADSSMPNELIIEMLPLEWQMQQEKEERLYELAQANKEMIRNLAHEIKNPLGGIRGAAQLLQMEMSSLELMDYTKVIIYEADRLQNLVDRLLEPHRKAQTLELVNIHEVCERVCALMLAEFAKGLEIVRDYDISIPEFQADKSQLIQAILNIAHNAAQALKTEIANGRAVIEFKTRILRQWAYGRKRHRLALELSIIDNGPGVPEHLREHIFFPLVTGKEGGSGLGLTLSQIFIHQHGGLIECKSQPGMTEFKIIMPLQTQELTE